jgi:molybdopterin-guanine dinucleotide biosynthesis protein A
MKAGTGVVMAGGQSTRMGRDKALLECHGRPLWLVQAEKLNHVAEETLLSVREEQGFGGSYRKVRDLVPGRGPLCGLLSALRSARFDPILLLAVDMPAMTTDYLGALLEQSTGETGVAPELDGFFQGFAAVYPRRIEPLVAEILAGADPSFQHLIRCALDRKMMRVIPVMESQRALFLNWNRRQPEDEGEED